MIEQNRIAVIIPSLNPDERLLQVLRDLERMCLVSRLVVVNDGSQPSCEALFDAAREYGCVVLKHYRNLGKGRALKTAFNYVLNTWPDCEGVVTMDADGQHSARDVAACAQAMLDHPEALIMGCRDFSGEGVPPRSRFGNRITCRVLRWLCGIRVSDTQTGLRGIPREHMSTFLSTHGERFEYEMNMLVETKEHAIPIMEVPIETIYQKETYSSHFNPLVDSFKIYKVFLGFIVASLSSFVIDITLFTILIYFLRPVMPALYIYVGTVGARVVSSLFNFLANKNGVFKGHSRSTSAMIKYFMLVIVQLTLSALGVKGLFLLTRFPEPILKVFVDVILFIISFQVQREWVFRREKKEV